MVYADLRRKGRVFLSLAGIRAPSQAEYPGRFYRRGSPNLSLFKRNEEAEGAYRKAIELKPDDAVAYYNLGNLLYNLKRNEEAEGAYRKAIELKPDNASAYGNLGWMFYVMGKWDQSIEASRQGLAKDPTQMGIQFNLALALLCRGDEESAKAEYRKGMESADTSSLEAAIADLKEVLEKDPDLPGAREILAQLEGHL